MNKLTYILPFALMFAACGSLRKTTSPTVTRTTTRSPKFIESISISPGSEQSTANQSINSELSVAGKNAETYKGNIETSSSLQFKYAILLDEPVEKLTNFSLLQFMDEWYGTRYRFGGNSKSGIDCSAFACTMMSAVFGKAVPRTSREQFDKSQKIPASYLQEGDLVFFNTRGGVSHVGVYLSNNKFIHASTSSGVTISDLDEAYYKRRFVGAGRN